jgi:hypothetical protein
VARFEVRVDGERAARVEGEDAVRAWVATYREEHAEDDPAAAHVQVIRLRLFGGALVPREHFFA